MTFGSILSFALVAVAVLGAITSTVYSLMAALGVLRFHRRAAARGTRSFLPPVSVLKPVHGDEPDLEENLASFFEQDYPEFEILFCARHNSDAGLQAARRVAARFPQVKARFLTCGEPLWPNARTFSLEIMRREARYPILVTADSDVRVGPGLSGRGGRTAQRPPRRHGHLSLPRRHTPRTLGATGGDGNVAWR